MSIVNDLRSLPLFQGIGDAQLAELVSAFQARTYPTGTVLFRPDDVATHFEILTKGEVTIEEEGGPRFALRPVAPLGELGALTGIPRSTTATAATEIEVHAILIADLLGFFDAHGDIGLSFYKNLLSVVSDKVRRDRQRMDDMRTNIIRTQKAMKKMRATVLDASETPISKPLFETLDTLIDNNRRANYRVTPASIYPAHVRLDDGRQAKVLEVSEGFVKVEGKRQDFLKDPAYWTGVLVVPSDEILLSGTVVRDGADGVVLKLDRPVDEFKHKLDDYTTRVQLLDYVV